MTVQAKNRLHLYTRGLPCHRIFVMQYQALYSHATSRNTKVNIFAGRIRIRVLVLVFWVVLAGSMF